MAKMNRRGFLGWLGISVPAVLVASEVRGSSPKKEMPKKVLAVQRCPKCKDWMHLPVEAKYRGYVIYTGGGCSSTASSPNNDMWSRYMEVPITCTCRLCGYSVTEGVMCNVLPRVE